MRRPKFREQCPEASIREGPEELTPRAEEVGSKKSCINIDHIAEDRWGPFLVDADLHAFCQAIYKGIEGSEWEDMHEHYKEMSKAAGVRKPNESQKSAGPVEDEGSKRQWRGFFMTQNAKTTFWEEINRDWNCGKSTSKTRLWLWTKP